MPPHPAGLEVLAVPECFARPDLQLMWWLGDSVAATIEEHFEELAEFKANAITRSGCARHVMSPPPPPRIASLRMAAAFAGASAEFDLRGGEGQPLPIVERLVRRSDLAVMWRLGERMASGLEDLVGELAEHHARPLGRDGTSRKPDSFATRQDMKQRVVAAFAGASARYAQHAAVLEWRADHGHPDA